MAGFEIPGAKNDLGSACSSDTRTIIYDLICTTICINHFHISIQIIK